MLSIKYYTLFGMKYVHDEEKLPLVWTSKIDEHNLEIVFKISSNHILVRQVRKKKAKN